MGLVAIRPWCRVTFSDGRTDTTGRQDRVTTDGREEVTPCNRTSATEVTLTLSGSAATRRKTATVILGVPDNVVLTLVAS